MQISTKQLYQLLLLQQQFTLILIINKHATWQINPKRKKDKNFIAFYKNKHVL